MDSFIDNLKGALGTVGVEYGVEDSESVLPQPFGPRKKDPLATSESFGTEVPLVFFTRTFTVFRPWTTCGRCLRRIESGEIQVDEYEGDMICPHTQGADYEKLINRILNGRALLLSRETYSHMETCTQYVRVEWAEKDETAIARLERKKREQAEEA